ncbi:MAG: hypothetical protein IJG40_01800 [Oscillospiraceae bacterium]|nr:hypothetical protein [Oscillospiraceae bacterium]
MNMLFVLGFDLLVAVAVTAAGFARKVLYAEGAQNENELLYLYNSMDDWN